MKFLWPLLAKLHKNAFDATSGTTMRDGAPVEGNCAVVRNSVVKVATSACSPYEYNSNYIATN